ncbi:hypothetical protein GpartN1_g1946.t1 [Galdieria partita]|uniref:Laminin G domain-containing protein n=1 Tax=Galdieria partita TaxID=83374 RepID=A0A9C7PTM2_9RHOD|nr:hypothetical protein GpartN1_g1946.t1 [Galdieria partita]
MTDFYLESAEIDAVSVGSSLSASYMASDYVEMTNFIEGPTYITYAATTWHTPYLQIPYSSFATFAAVSGWTNNSYEAALQSDEQWIVAVGNQTDSSFIYGPFLTDMKELQLKSIPSTSTALINSVILNGTTVLVSLDEAADDVGLMYYPLKVDPSLSERDLIVLNTSFMSISGETVMIEIDPDAAFPNSSKVVLSDNFRMMSSTGWQVENGFPVFSFQGSNKNYGYFTTVVDNPTTFSICAWFKSTVPSGIIEFSLDTPPNTDYDRVIALSKNGEVKAGIWTGSEDVVTTAGDINYLDGNWHFVVFTSDDANIYLYLDGSLKETASGVPQDYNGYWNIGATLAASWSSLDSPHNYYTGLFKGVAISSSVCITADQVTQLTNAPNYQQYRTILNSISSDWLQMATTGTTLTNNLYLLENGAKISSSSPFAQNGYSFEFVSTNNQYLTTVDTFDDPQNFTICFWFRTTQETGGICTFTEPENYPVSGNYDYQIWLESGTLKWGVNYYGTYTVSSSSSAYHDGSWHFVCASITSGSELYVDGVLVGSHPEEIGYQDYVGRFVFGSFIASGFASSLENYTYYFTGNLSGISVVSVLSAEEISFLYSLTDYDDYCRFCYQHSPLFVYPSLPQVSSFSEIQDPDSLALDSSLSAGSYTLVNGSSLLNDAGPFKGWPGFAFDQSKSQYVRTSPTFDNPQNFTICCWFITSTDGGICAFNTLGDFGTATANHDRMLWINSGILYAGVDPLGGNDEKYLLSTSSSVDDGQWHFACMSISSDYGYQLYLDGKLVDSNSSVTSAYDFSGNWYFGGYNNGGSWDYSPSNRFFLGTISGFAVCSVLSPSQVYALYRCTSYADYCNFLTSADASICFYFNPSTVSTWSALDQWNGSSKIKTFYKPTIHSKAPKHYLITSGSGGGGPSCMNSTDNGSSIFDFYIDSDSSIQPFGSAIVTTGSESNYFRDLSDFTYWEVFDDGWQSSISYSVTSNYEYLIGSTFEFNSLTFSGEVGVYDPSSDQITGAFNFLTITAFGEYSSDLSENTGKTSSDFELSPLAPSSNWTIKTITYSPSSSNEQLYVGAFSPFGPSYAKYASAFLTKYANTVNRLIPRSTITIELTFFNNSSDELPAGTTQYFTLNYSETSSVLSTYTNITCSSPLYLDWIDSDGIGHFWINIHRSVPVGAAITEELKVFPFEPYLMDGVFYGANYSVFGEKNNSSAAYPDNGRYVFFSYGNFTTGEIPSNVIIPSAGVSFTPAIVSPSTTYNSDTPGSYNLYGTYAVNSQYCLQTLNDSQDAMSFFRPTETLSELPFTIEFSWSYLGSPPPADNTGVGFLMEGLPSGNGGYEPEASNGYYATYEFYENFHPGVYSNGTSLTDSGYGMLNNFSSSHTVFYVAYSKVEVSSSQISMYYSGGARIEDSGTTYNFPSQGLYTHYLEPSKYTGTDSSYNWSGYSSPSGGDPIATYSGTVETTNNNFYFAAACGWYVSFEFFYWFRIRKGITLMPFTYRQVLNH